MTLTAQGATARSLFEKLRRKLVSEEARRTGLDHVQVEPVRPHGFKMTLFFLPQEGTGRAVLPPDLTPANLRILRADGSPVAGVWVRSVGRGKEEGDDVYVAAVEADPRVAERLVHDFSWYVLEIVGVPEVDRFLGRELFSWRGALESPEPELPAVVPDLPPPADIDYLAKDFQSFRKLMLDRMALLLPEWPERNPVDLGVAIIEVLAYAADNLSYYQDAVATEAYLETARERISVRRHVRLLDYTLHEGCNARVWLEIQPAGQESPVVPEGTEVLTGGAEEGMVERSLEISSTYQQKIASGAQVFETLYEARLRPELSVLKPYAWGLSEFILPAGSTRAALEWSFKVARKIDPEVTEIEPAKLLQEGDVLVFRQARNPSSGGMAGLDLRLAHAVRLCEPPRYTCDGGTDLVEVAWHEEDALPFDLWVVRKTREKVLTDLAEVHGNVVLADHGLTICEKLPVVPESGSYRPMLLERNLVFSVPFDPKTAQSLPAGAALVQNPAEALPAIVLYEVNERYFYPHAKPAHQAPPSQVQTFFYQSATASPEADVPSPPPPRLSRSDRIFAERLKLEADQLPFVDLWRPRHDLLESGRFARDFVVEPEADGRFRLRFGDGVQGLEPSSGSRFWAVYRIGSPARGNVGPHTVTQLVQEGELTAGLASARNHVAAQGGRLPEDIEVARRDAPQAFHIQQRCVTEKDYVRLAEGFPGVLKAQCVKSWNGSGTTATVSVQRQGGRPSDSSFLEKVDLYLRPFVLLGHQVEVRAPDLVPLLITLSVEVEPGYLESTVRDSLFQVLGARRLPDGRTGFFYPDRFTFGQPVYLSEVIAAAMAVHGVATVEALRFHRLGRKQGNELETGWIEMDDLEIAQCRNDPAAPERGRIELRLKGAQ